MHKERNLQQVISCLRNRRKFASLQCIDSAIDFVADLYVFFAEVKCRLLQNRPWGLHPQTPVESTDAANQNLHLPHPLILQLPTKGGCNFLYFTFAINTYTIYPLMK